MARIRPFPSGRPPRKLASRVASVPYDVVDTREARALAAGNPLSFLHVCRPEIDLPEDVDIHSDAVYAKGRENLDALLRERHARERSRAPASRLPADVEGAHAGRPRRDVLGRRLRHGRHPQAREDAARQGRRPRPTPARAVRARRARVPDLPGGGRDRRPRRPGDRGARGVRLRGAGRRQTHALDRARRGDVAFFVASFAAVPLPLRRRRPPPLRVGRAGRGLPSRRSSGPCRTSIPSTGSRPRSSRTSSSQSFPITVS